MLYKKIKDKYKQLKTKEKNNISRRYSDDEFELNYDSESIKSTESIHEARKKIENPRRIISLLNNLNAINFNDPIEKEEFLKNLINFEEKYGKLDEEEVEEGHVTKRSKDSNLNTDRSKKNQNIIERKSDENEENKANNLKEKSSALLKMDEKINNSEESKNETKIKLDALETFDNLKKSFDEKISGRKALESLSKNQNSKDFNFNDPLLIANENLEKDLLFLTNAEDIILKYQEKESAKIPMTEPISSNILNKNKNESDMEHLKNQSSYKENISKNEIDKDKNMKDSRMSKNRKDNSSSNHNEQEINVKKLPSKNDITKQENNLRIENKTQLKQEIYKDIDKILYKNNIDRNDNNDNLAVNNKDKKKNISSRAKKDNDVMDNLSSPLKNQSFSGESFSENDDNLPKDGKLSKKNIKNNKRNKKNQLSKYNSTRKGKRTSLDLESMKRKDNEINKSNEFSSENFFNLIKENESSYSLENEDFDQLSQSSLSINKGESEVKDKKFTISKEKKQKIITNESDDRKKHHHSISSNNLEDSYEMIDDLMDEDLDVLIKTSDKNDIMNNSKNEEMRKEMKKTRKLLIKKLEKKYGKNHVKEKIRQIEKTIEQTSNIEKVNKKNIYLFVF